jgi:hypothetical protein
VQTYRRISRGKMLVCSVQEQHNSIVLRTQLRMNHTTNTSMCRLSTLKYVLEVLLHTDLRCRQNKTVQCFVLGSVQSTRQQDANTIKSPPRSCWSREGMPLVAFIKSSFLAPPRSKGARKVAKETNDVSNEKKEGRKEGINEQKTEGNRQTTKM